MWKKMLVLLLMIVSTLFFTSTVYSATTGQITGSFTSSGYNNQSIIAEEISVYHIDENAYTEVGMLTSSLTPDLEYYIEFSVSDLDGLEDIELDIYLFFYEDYDLSVTDEQLFSVGTNHINTNEEALHVTWDGVFENDVLISEDFVLEKDESFTNWKLDPSITVDSSSVNLKSVSIGSKYNRTYKVYFTTEKVAPYSSSGEWQVLIVSNDKKLSETEPDQVFQYKTQLTMQYYGEVNLDSISTLEWNDVYPGMSYDDENAKGSIQNIKYLSNAPYYIIVKSSEVWNQVVGNVNVNATVTNNALLDNTVSIVATTASVWSSNLNSIGQIDFLNLKPIGDVNERTTAIYDMKDVYLYLKLSPQFQNGQYQGTISIGIVNAI